MRSIPYSKQSIKAQDIRAVASILSTDWITQGPKIEEFEEAIADYCGAKYAVAVSNGTAALHLACLAAGLQKGDEAITTPISFLATSNAVLFAGAKPVFADIDYETANIDPESVKKHINKKTKAIIPIDFAGLPADMNKIKRLSSRQRLIVIEDASHALGAAYDRKHKVGSCTDSDMTTFSFHPVKHITTGEGGLITTNDKILYERLKSLRSHGVSRSEVIQQKHGAWYYEMKELGMNYRITDFQCALGLEQLKRLEFFLRVRERISRTYDKAFQALNEFLKIPAQKMTRGRHARHLYLLRLKGKRASATRRKLFDHLRANGIYAQVHYIPIYKQPYYRRLFSSKRIHCPNAERYYNEVLSLPLFPDLQEKEIQHTIRVVKGFFS